MTGPRIETERLVLRVPEERDAAAYIPFMLSDRARLLGGPAKDERDAWFFFYTEIGHWTLRGYGMFALEDRASGASRGMVGPWHPHTWPAREIGWYVYDGSEGRGYAHEAAVAAREYARAVLGWDRIVSFIHRDNARSIALAQRLGCWHDADAVGPDADDLVYVHPMAEAA